MPKVKKGTFFNAEREEGALPWGQQEECDRHAQARDEGDEARPEVEAGEGAVVEGVEAQVEGVEGDGAGQGEAGGGAAVADRGYGQQDGQGQERRAQVGREVLVVRRVRGGPVVAEAGERGEEVARGGVGPQPPPQVHHRHAGQPEPDDELRHACSSLRSSQAWPLGS
ncbi:hypothetical protein ACFQZ4_33400 [Catellatospora coxensis]